jgi:hypothetical protein
MTCKITLSLISESLTGDVGKDWTYSVTADLLDPLIFGSGTVQVPLHVLRPGTTQTPPSEGRVVQFDAGGCGGTVQVRLTLRATEVDPLVDDHGSNVLVVPVECPPPGGAPYTTEPEIAARVTEAPRVQNRVAELRVKVRLVARCV